jgi:SAM-dependent methyltransferase
VGSSLSFLAGERSGPAQTARVAVQRWLRFWRRVEGPELEPPIWHSHYLSARANQARLGALCRNLSGRVLDIGAGTGLGGRFLALRRTQYIPIDLRSARDSADARITRQGRKPEIVCSGYQLPFKGSSIDAVMAHSLLEHVRDPSAILAEAWRVLVPGGTLIVSVPFCFPVHGFPDDFRRWTSEGLKLDIAGVGFDISSARPIGNALDSLALNFNLLLRYQLPSSSRVLYALCSMAVPFLLLAHVVVNLLAVLLGPLDRSGAMPIGVVVEARKGQRSDQRVARFGVRR